MYNFIKTRDNLVKNGFEVSHFSTGKEAAEYINSRIDGKTVGFGGSVTLKEIGLEDLLKSHNEVFNHWSGSSLAQAAAADVYICSVNGMSENGEIINIDGTGNRVASMSYGHKEIYYVAGSQKIEKNFEKALWRARNIASPKNAQRLGRKTPCAVNADRCYDCSSPDRICSSLCVLWKKPRSFERAEVVLVDEELGF